MAKTHELDGASLADIYRRYGDHLYSKGNYDGSMQQFIETLGHLQPSYVIRKVNTTYCIRISFNDLFVS